MEEFVVPVASETRDLAMADGAVLKLRRHGNPKGPRLVLCHGNGFATDAYWPFWRHLADRYDLVVYDQRNHGRNPRHDVAHHDVPYFADDMERVIDGVRTRWGSKPTAGVFHSISAITAILHASERGPRWDALVLFDPPLVPSPGHPFHELARDFELGLAKWALTRPNRFNDPAHLAALFAKSKSLRRWVPGAHALMARSILSRVDGGYELACPREGESRVYATNSRLDLAPRLAALGMPVKFVGSDPDDAEARAPGKVNRALAEVHGHAYEAVPGTSHMLQVEAPEACARIVEDFLGRLGLAGAVLR
jgi:pimeloyl-ACP methyl ester carboxylesterase